MTTNPPKIATLEGTMKDWRETAELLRRAASALWGTGKDELRVALLDGAHSCDDHAEGIEEQLKEMGYGQ